MKVHPKRNYANAAKRKRASGKIKDELVIVAETPEDFERCIEP